MNQALFSKILVGDDGTIEGVHNPEYELLLHEDVRDEAEGARPDGHSELVGPEIAGSADREDIFAPGATGASDRISANTRRSHKTPTGVSRSSVGNDADERTLEMQEPRPNSRAEVQEATGWWARGDSPPGSGEVSLLAERARVPPLSTASMPPGRG
jgi:hypothetical protein